MKGLSILSILHPNMFSKAFKTINSTLTVVNNIWLPSKITFKKFCVNQFFFLRAGHFVKKSLCQNYFYNYLWRITYTLTKNIPINHKCTGGGGGAGGWGGIKVYPPSKILAKLVNKNAIKHQKDVPSPKNFYNPYIPSLPKFGKNLIDPPPRISNRVHLCYKPNLI